MSNGAQIISSRAEMCVVRLKLFAAEMNSV
jgi:hypothetical protein